MKAGSQEGGRSPDRLGRSSVLPKYASRELDGNWTCCGSTGRVWMLAAPIPPAGACAPAWSSSSQEVAKLAWHSHTWSSSQPLLLMGSFPLTFLRAEVTVRQCQSGWSLKRLVLLPWNLLFCTSHTVCVGGVTFWATLPWHTRAPPTSPPRMCLRGPLASQMFSLILLCSEIPSKAFTSNFSKSQ